MKTSSPQWCESQSKGQRNWSGLKLDLFHVFLPARHKFPRVSKRLLIHANTLKGPLTCFWGCVAKDVMDVRWPLLFFNRNRFYSQLTPHCPKMNKTSMWEVKKISRFLSTGHRILPLWSLNNLTSCLNSFNRSTWTIFGREDFTSKIYIALFLGLQTLWPYSRTKPDFSHLGCSFGLGLS